MIKKSIVFIIVSCFLSQVYALDNRLALELVRTKKTANVIKRVNNLYAYINLFIMQNGRAPTDITEINSSYANINAEGYLSGSIISFTIANNIVNFTGLIPTNSSNLVVEHYSNSSGLHVNAVVNTADLSMSITLEPETIKFLTYVSRLQALDVSALVQDAEPTCNAGTNIGRLWYQPDAMGGVNISYCAPGWTLLSNKISIEIYRQTLAALTAINPPNGTIGYVLDVSSGVPPYTEAKQYIYDSVDSAWKEVVN
jgi:hypothetical protein